MRLILLLLGMVWFSVPVTAQIDSLIHSGWTIDYANVMADSEKYDVAIRAIDRIDPRDTNYWHAQERRASFYLQAGNASEALEVASKALENRSGHRVLLLLWKAQAYEILKSYDKAEATLLAAEREFPFETRFIFERGLNRFNHGAFSEAEDLFFRVLAINPFHGDAHRFLSLLSMRRGERTRAAISMATYLAINPGENSRLVLLNEYLSDEVTDEFDLPPSSNNPYLRLDAILQSRVAELEGYKVRIPLNFVVVKEMQLLLEELPKVTPANDGWARIYLPAFIKIQQQGLSDALIYHILTSTGNEVVKEWSKKNEAQLNKMFTIVNESFGSIRATVQPPPSLGVSGPLQASYYSNNAMEGLGPVNAKGEREGLWHYYSSNGELSAKGVFRAGTKVGWWTYWNDEGYPTSSENLDKGEINMLTPDSLVYQRYFLKDEVVTGKVENFYRTGAVQQTLLYVNGKQNGPAAEYYPSGQLKESYVVKDDQLDGKRIVYWDNGKIQSEQTYVMGKREGATRSYHRNGNLSYEGTYRDGLAEGIWRYYDLKGHLKQHRSFTKEQYAGNWTDYDARGKVSRTFSYDDKEQFHGAYESYTSGIRRLTLVYDHGKVNSRSSYDMTGEKILSTHGDPSGTFNGTDMFEPGKVTRKYNYLNGLQQGEWVHLNRFGAVIKKMMWNENKESGEWRDFNKMGGLQTVYSYDENGKEHGKYTRYYDNGKMAETGWYVHGVKEQRWIAYHDNGNISMDSYYLRDVLTGYVLAYRSDGKLIQRLTYDKGAVLQDFQYDESGKLVGKFDTKGVEKSWETKYPSGKLQYKAGVSGGLLDGEEVAYYPDGTPFLSHTYHNGQKGGKRLKYFPNGKLEVEVEMEEDQYHGRFLSYYPNGSIRTEGFYREGSMDSTWRFYHVNGQVQSVAEYLNGDRHGLCTNYGPEGMPFLERNYVGDDVVSYRTNRSDGKPGEWQPFSGEESVKYYYADGKLAGEDVFHLGIANGNRKVYYHANGKIYQWQRFKDLFLEGEQIYYYPDGKILSRETTVKDLTVGPYELFAHDGSPVVRLMMDNDVLHGVSVYYYNGKKKEVKFWGGYPTE